jgi:tripartite-type tricarboxylate transporter receptor subunit TctC
MKMMQSFTIAACLVTALVAGPASAEGYPVRPVKVIVPFGAGSGADVPARRITAEMSKFLNHQPLVIENKVGAGGVVGSEAVAKAPSDGYTLLVGTMNTHGISSGLYKRLPYDPLKSYQPLSRIAAFPNVLVVAPSLGVTSMQDLIARARASREPLTYSSSGVGTAIHLSGELFQKAAQVRLLHVPYSDISQYLPDVVAGRTDMTFGNLPQVLPFITAGKLLPVAITSSQRSNLLPQVPTMRELGFKDAEMSIWIGMFAPAGTPPQVADALNRAIRGAQAEHRVIDSFSADGISVIGDASPAEFAKFLALDVPRWVQAVEEAGVPKQ